MLISQEKYFHRTLFNLLSIVVLIFLYSCVPSSVGPRTTTAETLENSPDSDSGSPNYKEPAFPISGIFAQEGSTRTKTNLLLPLTFSDSFLIRGLELSQYLRTIPETTRFCLVGKYNHISGQDKFLILSAKPKFFIDFINKTKEHYLKVEPSSLSSNQNDCQNYNLSNTLFLNATSPSLSYSFSQLCSNCTSTISSSSLKLYFANGELVPSFTLNSLVMSLTGFTSFNSSICTESITCTANGFDCCLQGQCVTDGALRPGANTLAGFSAAKADVDQNPDHFINYPQFYFVCSSRPHDDPSEPNDPEDPDYDAVVRLMELRQLHECLNQGEDEFSFCTIKFPNAQSSMPGTFSASASGFNDDINFSNLNPHLMNGDKKNNIYKITYAGNVIYEQDKTSLLQGSFSAPNDNLVTSQSVTLNLTTPSSAKDSHLYITYKVDGTCERVTSSLAKCSKTYIQDYSDTSSTYWHDNSKIFKLPTYADTSQSASIIIKIGGINVPEESSSWTKAENPNRIIFHSSYPLYQNQRVEITYYVKENSEELTKLKTIAQKIVNSKCNCSSDQECNLTPNFGLDNSSVVDYQCSYPTSAPADPPVNQTVYVSNKNIPHRYFDINGVNYDEEYGSAPPQELTSFNYINNDLLKPNNVSQHIGFNEIYGSLSVPGAYMARPAKMVRIKKGKQYDIIVNSGAFSSCISCGNDYYSSLQKIFPQNFVGRGGGYTPDLYETRRQGSSSPYRSDDLKYGRACFVPATMIPWTHHTASSPKLQRRNRLSAQHFLFANGYQRDWYGFDYGSLIGSFDGVRWFSIGNQRRISSSTTKLYLAVNAYLGDLNLDSNFNVLISETTPYSPQIPDHDMETDGTECQRSHFCSNDNDCFTQLGYEYTCQNISSLRTNWPLFDGNGSEVIGSSPRTLASILGGTNGESKRCVYRGRGAPCLEDLSTASSGNHFNGSTLTGTLMCSHNNACTSLNKTSFNDRIARFGRSPLVQNTAEAASDQSDIVGMGARIILRPFDYDGSKAPPLEAKSALSANEVNAICIPGRDLSNATTTFDLNRLSPTNRTEKSDKIFGIGPTLGSSQSLKSLSACPATNDQGIITHLLDTILDDENFKRFSISQNLSSNLLNLTPLIDQNLFSSLNGSLISSVGYQRNACLRAPGATCFSDMDCAPSSFIAGKVRSADLTSVLNEAEIKFWEEELVCGNPDFKTTSPGVLNSDFDITKNRCCREFGEKISVYTQFNDSPYKWCKSNHSINVAGVNTPISSSDRYSRVHSAYDKMTCNKDEITINKKFALSIAAEESSDRFKQILGQYKTLDTINERTCCTGHWVRSFSSENGGGHHFKREKMQNIDKTMFKYLSWLPDVTTGSSDPDTAFECDPFFINSPSCEIKDLTPEEQEKYLSWASSLELIGIPQVAIKTNDQIFKLVDSDQKSLIADKKPLTDSNGKEIIKQVSNSQEDFHDNLYKYYSASNYENLNMTNPSTQNDLKKVFSESEFNCCIPSGQEVPDSITSSQCCTGLVAEINGQRRCCLEDFTNVSVYLNRYVSSEGRGLSSLSYDESTGFIKDPAVVAAIAAQKNLCCSGQTATGVAVGNLPIPVTGDTYITPATSSNTTKRFNYRTDSVDNNTDTGSIGERFDAGVRWNNQVYCVPANF